MAMKEVPTRYDERMYGTRAPIEPSLVPATKNEKPELKSFNSGRKGGSSGGTYDEALVVGSSMSWRSSVPGSRAIMTQDTFQVRFAR
jgi:hypothetical protein